MAMNEHRHVTITPNDFIIISANPIPGNEKLDTKETTRQIEMMDEVGMGGYLYRYCAKLGRGNVWITGPDFENPDEDCRWIVCSYFPDEGKVYLLNLDYERERTCVLQQFGDKDFLTLKPGEFRIVDSVRLDPGEKLNEM